MSTLSLKIFNVTAHCPICGGSAGARYHGPQEQAPPRMERRCEDCGFRWQEKPVSRSL